MLQKEQNRFPSGVLGLTSPRRQGLQESGCSIPKGAPVLLALLPTKVIEQRITSNYPPPSQVGCREFATTEHGTDPVFRQTQDRCEHAHREQRGEVPDLSISNANAGG
jgi:hypothetical protein